MVEILGDGALTVNADEISIFFLSGTAILPTRRAILKYLDFEKAQEQ